MLIKKWSSEKNGVLLLKKKKGLNKYFEIPSSLCRRGYVGCLQLSQ